MSPTGTSLPAATSLGRPRIAPAPAAQWLQVPRLLLTLAGLRLQRAWQPERERCSRRQLVADWEF